MLGNKQSDVPAFSGGDRRGLASGIGAVVVVVLLGVIIGGTAIPVLTVMIGVFVACVSARPRATAIVGLVSLVGVAILSVAYELDGGQLIVRLITQVVATAVAVYLAYARDSRDQTAILQDERNELALRFELLMREAPVGFLLVDHQLDIIVVNQKLAGLRDLEVEDFLGKRLTEVQGVSGAAKDLEQAMTTVLLSGSAVLGMSLADGQTSERGTREFEANVFPVTDPTAGTTVGVGATVQEVTDRNRSERYLEELLRDRDRVARALQESLLPPALPEPSGLAFSASYLPAGTGADLGGDFYDVFETVDDCWHIVLGDICGKGLAAASQIGLARHTVRAACVEHAEPAQTLELLNTVLYQQAESDRFLTAAHIVIDLTGWVPSCTIALGGHPPPLLVREGKVQELGEYGPLLGIHDRIEVPQVNLDLQVGDLIVAYTDGLIEDRHGRFGEADLRTFLEDAGGARPEEVVTALERELAQQRPGPPEDDVAIVAIRVER
jgi:sigma-B regulation protein RsbU (phosphoserine phosphatase)